MHTHIYIYIYRKREKNRQTAKQAKSNQVHQIHNSKSDMHILLLLSTPIVPISSSHCSTQPIRVHGPHGQEKRTSKKGKAESLKKEEKRSGIFYRKKNKQEFRGGVQ